MLDTANARIRAVLPTLMVMLGALWTVVGVTFGHWTGAPLGMAIAGLGIVIIRRSTPALAASASR